MISIKNKIIEFVEIVERTHKNKKQFFSDFQKTEESKFHAEKIMQRTIVEKAEVIINVKSIKEIDEIIYYMISILLEADLSSFLDRVYSKPESGIAIFSNFQNIVAKIYEMNVRFNIKN